MDCTLEEQAKYKEQDRERLEAYHEGDWCMMGITCDIQVKTTAAWAVPHKVGSASLWNVESDSEESYLQSVEAEMIAEAEADLKLTRDALVEAL
jgi:hypothetical protein